MLFIENSYLKDFESKILNIENNNIILEETAFYAKSGGQPGDTGKIILNNNEKITIAIIINENLEKFIYKNLDNSTNNNNILNDELNFSNDDILNNDNDIIDLSN